MKFRMIDRICSYEPALSICGTKAVSFEEYSIASAVGAASCLPPTLLMESVFQLGNWLIVLTSDFTEMGLLVRVGRVEFLKPVGPGERISVSISVKRYRDDGICFDGEASVDGRVVVRGESCLAAPAPLADYCNPADLRVLFSEIYTPGEDS